MLAVHKSHASILLRRTKSVVAVDLVIIPAPHVVFCLSSPLSSVTLRLLHMHYNRGSQVMNICVRPAVKISLITPRLESGAVPGRPTGSGPPPATSRGRGAAIFVLCLWQGLFVVLDSPLFRSCSLHGFRFFFFFFLRLLKGAKRKVSAAQQNKTTAIRQQGLVRLVDQYELTQLFGQTPYLRVRRDGRRR